MIRPLTAATAVLLLAVSCSSQDEQSALTSLPQQSPQISAPESTEPPPAPTNNPFLRGPTGALQLPAASDPNSPLDDPIPPPADEPAPLQPAQDTPAPNAEDCEESNKFAVIFGADPECEQEADPTAPPADAPAEQDPTDDPAPIVPTTTTEQEPSPTGPPDDSRPATTTTQPDDATSPQTEIAEEEPPPIPPELEELLPDFGTDETSIRDLYQLVFSPDPSMAIRSAQAAAYVTRSAHPQVQVELRELAEWMYTLCDSYLTGSQHKTKYRLFGDGSGIIEHIMQGQPGRHDQTVPPEDRPFYVAMALYAAYLVCEQDVVHLQDVPIYNPNHLSLTMTADREADYSPVVRILNALLDPPRTVEEAAERRMGAIGVEEQSRKSADDLLRSLFPSS